MSNDTELLFNTCKYGGANAQMQLAGRTLCEKQEAALICYEYGHTQMGDDLLHSKYS